MISLIISDDEHANLFELNKLLKNCNLKINRLFFDNNQWDLMNEISQTSLFNETSYFIIYEANFLTLKKDYELNHLLVEFLINHSDQNIVCLATSKKILEIELINKLVKKSKLIKPKKNNDYAKSLLIDELIKTSEISISPAGVDALKKNLPLDSYNIEGEINKLAALKKDRLNETDIKNIVFDYNNNNVFNLLLLVITKKYEAAVTLFDNLINLKYQVSELIQIMASQLYNIKLIKLGMVNSLSNNTILQKLSISNFQLIMQREILYNSISLINNLLDDLLDLDLKIKLGKAEPQLGFKLMILK